MNNKLILFALLSLLPIFLLGHDRHVQEPEDIFIIIYITRPGFSGHVGIAVDHHKILIKDELVDNRFSVRYDTVKSGTLTYFDLWGPPEINFGDYSKNLKARYYRLPRTSAEARITVNSLLTEGLPHSFDTPPDAIIRIKTAAKDDFGMVSVADSIQHARNYFNVRKYNCTDYAITCLNEYFHTALQAKEYIPFYWSSTPNQLYKELIKTFNTEIIKKPGKEIDHSFYRERVLKTIFFQNKNP